ncbi:MAG: hypothetical protein GF364_18785, partial [Candidatus Lokiarchaeota archaeon]|nr:hypothetical protein [Candidatus Lokiarchaeota archaeon]
MAKIRKRAKTDSSFIALLLGNPVNPEFKNRINERFEEIKDIIDEMRNSLEGNIPKDNYKKRLNKISSDLSDLPKNIDSILSSWKSF